MSADIKNQFNSSTFRDTTFNYGGKVISKALGSIPAIPSLFIGRENSTTDIHDRLKNNNNLLLLVNGKGGIGKTTMASQYYFEYAEYYSHLIWLVSEKGIKEAIISLAISLKISFPENFTQVQQINEILRSISELNKPVLLIIDNANDIVDLNENFQLLRQFHNTHILITSRINEHKQIDSYKVNHLDNKSANDLFKYYFESFDSGEQELLDQVLEAIGYNTLVIELLAKNLNEFNNDIKSHYPLQRLLEDIQQKGVLAISKSTEITADYKLQYAKPEDIIRTMYDISHLSENEKQILSIYAVLPATAIPFKFLELALPDIEELDIVLLKLTQKGWIDYDKEFQYFKTNPIISEIAREQNKDRLEDDTQKLVLLLINKLKYEPGIGHIDGDFNEIEKTVIVAETLVNNYGIVTYNKSVVFERLGNFYSTYGNLGKALEHFESYLELVEELYSKDTENVDFKNGLAISFEKLGTTHSTFGNLRKALEYFENETILFKELYASFPNNVDYKSGLAISYSKLGETHNSLGNFEKALKYFEDETILFEELYESHPNNVDFKNGLAISYEKLGSSHSLFGNFEKALKYFVDETILFEELYESHPNNVDFINGLAISYGKLGSIHSSLGNLKKALEYFEESSRIGKALYESHPNNVGFKNGLAISYSKLGSIHSSLGNFEKALEYFEESSRIGKALYESHPNNVGLKNGLAISYSKLGEIYSSLGNFEKALEYFEERSRIGKELYESHPNNVGFKNGLAISYSKLGETHSSLGNFEKALEYFEESSRIGKELYESHPNNVGFKNGLAISYINLGVLFNDSLDDKHKGIDFLNKAKEHFKELKEKYPKYAEFGENYDWVISKLKDLE